MGLFTTGGSEKAPENYLVKRCPDCFINLPLEATRCYSCKARVGKVDRHGKAKRKTNWYSYLACVISWGTFILYVRWAFF